MRSLATRVFDSHWFLPLLAGIAVLALVLSTFSVVQYTKAQTVRERDRIAGDLLACERGNENKQTYRTLAEAQRQYVDDVLSGVTTFAELSPDELEVLNFLLTPARSAIEEAIAQIRDVDCDAVVIGA